MILVEQSGSRGESSKVFALKFTIARLVQASTEFGGSLEIALKLGPNTMKYATINFNELILELGSPEQNSAKKSYR